MNIWIIYNIDCENGYVESEYDLREARDQGDQEKSDEIIRAQVWWDAYRRATYEIPDGKTLRCEVVDK